MILARIEGDSFARATAALASRPALLFFAIALIFTMARIAALFFTDADLGPDEAQYWVWSSDPDLGYFSKPPLIAWTIAATTALFGDAEWAVRLASPFYHLGAAVFVFLLARRLFGPAAGFWSGAGWITLPGVGLSSALITTDAPLLFFWSAALYFFFFILTTTRNRAAGGAALGLAIGLGLLAKYAMAFFLIGAMLAFLISPAVRKNMRLQDLAAAALVAALVIAPNLWWNAVNGFQTIAHTAANAKWGPDWFHPGSFAEFLAGQFAVFGPILIGLLIWGVATGSRRRSEVPTRGVELALLAFVIAPLVIVAAQALISRAHANWAATAYPAAILLASVWALRSNLRPLLAASLVLHVAATAVFMAMFADFGLADRLGFSDAVKRLRGWEVQGATIRAAAAPYDAILVDDRELTASVSYYARGDRPVVAWNSNHQVDSYFEAFKAFNPDRTRSALFVSIYPEPIALAGLFAETTPLGETSVDVKQERRRTYYLYGVSGYRPPRG